MKIGKKLEKIEKTVGYALLAVGLVFIILPALLALWMYLSGAQVPQFVPLPTEETDALTRTFAIFTNVCLLFFIFIIAVWAGSIITSRGVTLIKEVKLKLIRKGRGVAENEEA